ncbi:MAG: desulfoferrodoxin [Saccharofermentanales bacterium]|jgi:superoxide reductase|nr:desulfoferrodoxin [Clostridiaceae bacterium]
MTFERSFYYCSICKNLVELVEDGGGELICCGQPMELLTANTTDAATEKHLPVGERQGNKLHVKVSSVAHPMLEAHYIQWILVAQGAKTQRVDLEPEQAPEADFIVDDGPLSIYEYCNLHGLWVSDSD